MKNSILIVAMLLAGISALARAARAWTEAELREASQLVVVGTVTKVRDLDERNTALWPGGTKLRGLEATIAVSKVLKGDFTNRTLVLHYYRWDTAYKTSERESAFGPDPNSPLLIYLTPADTNQLKLYLVGDEGTRYAPASGQLDNARDSVRAARGLEFLDDIPSLAEASLKMTETDFLSLLQRQKLEYTKAARGGQIIYHVKPREDVTVIFSFRDGICSGIQRLPD